MSAKRRRMRRKLLLRSAGGGYAEPVAAGDSLALFDVGGVTLLVLGMV